MVRGPGNASHHGPPVRSIELVVRNRQDRQAPPSTEPRTGHSTSECDTVRVAWWQTIQLSFHSPVRMAAVP